MPTSTLMPAQTKRKGRTWAVEPVARAATGGKGPSAMAALREAGERMRLKAERMRLEAAARREAGKRLREARGAGGQ
jgi:hypothetical protein